MPDEFSIRPTLKRAKFSLALSFLFFVILLWIYLKFFSDKPWWVPLFGLIPFLFPLVAWIDTARTVLTVSGGYLRFRHGFVSQTSRTMDLSKIQDVRVERSLAQRLWNIGTLVVETAGETGQIVMSDIDRPQAVAEDILEAARARGEAPRNA